MTIYPSGIDSSLELPTVSGATQEDDAINALQSAVIAIETELGVNPHGIYSDVDTRLSILEARIGPGPVITGGPIDINDAILTGTLSILKGGTGLNSVGAGNKIIISNGVGLFYDFITNDNVDAAAAIAGTKIDPDFGSQNIITSGYLNADGYIITNGFIRFGTIPATTGTIRLSNTNTIYGRDSGNTTNFKLLQISSNDTIIIGDTNLNSLEVKPTTITSNGNSKVTITDVIRNTTTTNATITDIYTWTITDEAVTTVDCLITAIKNDASVGAGYKRTLTFRSNGGTVSSIASVHDNMTDEDAAGWDVTIDDDGAGTGRIRVTGASSTTITWGLAARIQVTVP